MSCAKNYENIFNFVKDMSKNTVDSFFPNTTYTYNHAFRSLGAKEKDCK